MASHCFQSLHASNPSSELCCYLKKLSIDCSVAAQKQEGVIIEGVEDKVIFDLSITLAIDGSINCHYETKWSVSTDLAHHLSKLFPEDTFDIIFEELACGHAGKIIVAERSVALYHVKDSFWDAVNAKGDQDEMPTIEEHLKEHPSDIHDVAVI